LASINCNAKPFIPKMWWCAIYSLQLNLGSHEESFDKVYSPFHSWSSYLFSFACICVNYYRWYVCCLKNCWQNKWKDVWWQQ
jgi:hypothetical protein